MAMKPKLVALNAGLALGLVLIVWQGRVKWEESQAERHASINVPVRKVTPPPMVPEQKPEAVQSAKYADVATKNLFSKDRNPNVVVDPPKPEEVKVMPPLPVVYGVLGLSSGLKAIMAEHSGAPSRSVRAGDEIGEFKILALDLRKVTFEWNGKQVQRDIDDLARYCRRYSAEFWEAQEAPPRAGVRDVAGNNAAHVELLLCDRRSLPRVPLRGWRPHQILDRLYNRRGVAPCERSAGMEYRPRPERISRLAACRT